MQIVNLSQQTVALTARVLNALQPAFSLGIRAWIGWQFFKSGLVKISSWDTTLYLFREEYHVPLAPPELAAIVGTFGELVFPVFLWVGLFGRLSALGMSAVNLMAVIAYAHVLLSEGFEAAIGQHYLWGFALLVLVVYGPGAWSADQWLLRKTSDKP